MKQMALLLLLMGMILTLGCRAKDENRTIAGSFEAVIIVLGNEPLDDDTPTVDMISRVKEAVAFNRRQPRSLLVFTGGKTAGRISEAGMMARIALSEGVATTSVCLEEEARTTIENADFTARLLANVTVSNVYVVSKSSHLQWAMPEFRRHSVFSKALPLASDVRREDTITQMEEYLRRKDSHRVRQRLEWLKKGVRGPD